MKAKMNIPFQMDLGDGTRSHVMYTEVTGEVTGPFLVHRSISKGHQRWSLTHMKTGYHCGDAPHKEPAKVAANRMAELADWEFDDPKAVQSWSPEVIEEIRMIRTIASAGGV